MTTYTGFLGLKKPGTSDFYNISDFNDNSITIDSAAYTIPHTNLIDNPNFTINQRGETAFDEDGIGLDRWKGTEGLTIQSGGHITGVGTLTQVFPAGRLDSVAGKKITVFVRGHLSDSTDISETGTINFINSGTQAMITGSQWFSCTITGTTHSIDVGIMDNRAMLDRVALYVGDVPKDVENDTIISDELEILKCYPYYQKVENTNGTPVPVGFGIVRSAQYGYVCIPVHGKFAKTPTVSTTGSTGIKIYRGNGSITNVERVQWMSQENDGMAILRVFVADTITMTAGEIFVMMLQSASIEFNADL